MSGLQPTPEQLEAVRLAPSCQRIAVEALAGTGKTTTLSLIAEQMSARAVYVAFNRAIVRDAAGKFGPHVDCRTAHSLAFRAVGSRYQARLNSPRLTPRQMVDILGCHEVRGSLESGRVIDAELAAQSAWRTAMRFAKTPDAEIGAQHVPPLVGLSRTGQAVLTQLVLPIALQAWADLVRTDGRLKFDHDVYLKLWQLSGPRIPAAHIMFDEAQDADPVMLDVVQAQEAQQIFVGDRFQAIYEWRGAINAMQSVQVDCRAWLTQSFRFGKPIAHQANAFLARLGAERQVVGDPNRRSRVGTVRSPVAVLTRTNAHAVTQVLAELERGGRPAIVGGGDEVIKFAEAAEALMNGRRTVHPQLACFENWNEVCSFVREASPEEAGEMPMLVRLVEGFGAKRLREALQRCVSEEQASLIVSTAHKAKGREWPSVRIGDDFPDVDKMEAEELRLAYVAVTRAMAELDVSGFDRDESDLFTQLLGRKTVASTSTSPRASGRTTTRTPGQTASRTSTRAAGPQITPAAASAELARRALPKGSRPQATNQAAFHATAATLRAIAAAEQSAARTTARPQKSPAARSVASTPTSTSRLTYPVQPQPKKPWWKRLVGR